MSSSQSDAGRRTSRGRPVRRVTALVVGMAMHVSAIGPVFAQPAPQPPAAPPAPAGARVLTLDDALALAGASNEQVDIAQAGVARAAGNQLLVRSERRPQLTGSASYDRALQSEFSGLFDQTGPSCTPLQVNPSAPLGDRVSEIERALIDCPPSSNPFGGGDSSNALPFGRKNTYRLGLVFSQVLFTGGRIRAQERRAELAKSNADVGLKATQAQLALDVSQAFFNAALADRVVAISEESFAQADRAFTQTRAQREAGRVSEFELLRAQVSRDTLQPDVVRQRAQRDVAYLRLKQLLDLPLDTPIQLAAGLDDAALPPPQRFATTLAEVEATRVPTEERIAVTQARNDVASQEEAVTVARAQRKPTIALTSNFGLVAYPTTAPAFDEWRRNWTIGANLSLPILTGGRIAASEAIARAGVAEQKARLSLTRELAALDAASARAELVAALSAWQASAGTIQQAARAYEIAELRYREGLSTQLELSDSRLLLAQAQLNRANAARTLQVARVRFALLPQLPLAAGSGTAAQGAAPTAAPSGDTSTGTSGPAAAARPAAAATGTSGAQ